MLHRSEEEESPAAAEVKPPPPQGPTPSAFQNRGQNLVRTFRHYRLVVEEVCKELTEFRSGKQLMSIIRDCVRAHADAVNNADILHRDVSGGNILICPTVVLDTDGKRRVVWKGMLTDWELSKPIPGEGKTESARQPVRTGTWQFTSAWILDNPEDAVRTADDVEAFFHVSLYMGLRYMRNNCNNLQMTMTMFDYFDNYSYDAEQERYLCGLHKQVSMTNGRLQDAGKKRFSFLDDDGKPGNHPIDAIFDVMLEWFRERYDALTRIPAPGKKLRVDDHTALLQLLDSKLDDPPPGGGKAAVWPENDKVGDQLKPAKKHGSDGADEKPRAKRVKTNDSGKGGARASGSGKRLPVGPPALLQPVLLLRGPGGIA
ncbi:hypothetical protein C8T65DRAFT_119812 [Cerioporus squamosus]|nr:hypothetical protein C8T65DRAFT_119812 [Cerioporus squamosus]